MNESIPQYDVFIVGGGVVGTALLYTLCKYIDIDKVCLIEKYSGFALVNSDSAKNSQTLHFGDIETNYSFEKAKSVKRMAYMVRNYVENEKASGNSLKIFSRYTKMVLAIGKFQVDQLEERFTSFRHLFHDLRVIKRYEIEKNEPRIVDGRDKDQPIIALMTNDGYTIDYKRLSQSFVDNAKAEKPDISVHIDTKFIEINKCEGLYKLKTNKGELSAETVIIAAGGHSLLIAKSLGYGKNLSVLSMAGSFYTSPKVLSGKVYTIQVAKLPFAAIHGDPEIHDKSVARFGPTAKPIFLLERHNISTFLESWKTFGLGISPIINLLKIVCDKALLSYLFMNFMYDLPFIGKRLFMKQIKMIVPSIKLKEIKYSKGHGGTQPQIVNNKTRSLEMRETKIIGDKIIFNITPSPGASTCLGNAYSDVSTLISFVDNKFEFNKEGFEKDLVSFMSLVS